MRKWLLALAMLLFTGFCALLFSGVYRDAKNAAIANLNAEQKIHAKQAARGIEDFFSAWRSSLAALAKMDEVIDADGDGARNLQLFYEAHREQIRSITRVDERGVIVATYPFTGVVGSDISSQEHVREILRTHEPIVSDAFRAVQGFEAVALHVPVFRGAEFKGSLAVVLDFDSVVKRYLDVIKIGDTGYAWVVSRGGTILYSPVPGLPGQRALERFRSSPSATAILSAMLEGREGVGTYVVDLGGQPAAGPVLKYAVYVPVRLPGTFWSVAVASSERELLAGLVAFRNRLALIVGLVYLGGMAFAVGGAKAWLTVRAEERRRQAEQTSRESEQRFHTLFESSPDGIFLTDPETLEIVDCNPAACAMNGYDRRELLGRSINVLHTEEVVRRLEGGVEGRRAFVRRLGEEGSVTVRSVHRRKDGSLFDLETSMCLLTLAGRVLVMGIDRDITGRKAAEEERRRLAAAIEQSAEAVVITDRNGTVVYVNPAFEWITGYAADEVVGRSPSVLKSGKHDPSFYAQMWTTITRGSVWVGRLTNRRKDGSLYEEEMSISPVRDAKGEIINFVAVKRDVTQETELRQQLNEAQKMEAIGRLAGGIAHDFNNLLQAMTGQVQLVRSRSEDPDTVRALSRELDQQIGRGASFTRQLLLFARRETVKRERLDLNDAVRESASMLKRLVRADIAMRVELADGPLQVEADRGQLDQVLMNLTLNAVDAMQDGGRLTFRTGSDSGRKVWLAVEDTGPGIPEEVRERMFEPFFTTKAAGKGTGLGLSVVHGIVTQHGGRIDVESAPGTGTTFRVTLAAAGAGEAVATDDGSARGRTPPPGRGERVLVVEDEDIARQGLQGILAELGYAVVGVRSGEDAIAIPDDPPFDLLLTDVVLPGAAGPAVADSLKGRWPALRVVLMSGYAEDEAVRRGVSVGAVRFLQKPFGIDALARELRAALDGPPTPR